MIEVKIRHLDEIDGVKLGDLDPSEISSLLDLIKSKEKDLQFYFLESDNDSAGFWGTQFVIGKNKAWFEIIVGDEK